MFLQKIGVAGWRSFSPEHAATLNNLGQVNLVIGPNNVGKSNIGRFVIRLRDILRQNGCHQYKPWEDNGVYFRTLSLAVETEEIDHWLRESAPIKAEIDFLAASLGAAQELPSWLRDGDRVRFAVTIARKSNGDGELSICPITPTGSPVIRCEGNAYQLLQADGEYTEQVLGGNNHWYRGLALAACHCIATSVFEVKALRDPKRTGGQETEGSTDGGEIIQKLLKSQNDVNDQAFWTRCKEDIEEWLARLLGDTELRIDVNNSGFWVETRRGQRRLRCALTDLGAGVSEMVMLLAYIRLCPDRNLLVVLDEPEAHLHPGAAVELVRIINKHLPKHQLLITTHSTALIDAITPTWRAFRAFRADHGGTAIENLDTSYTELALLADLGIHPSQMFLAQVVIWVEGPSDILYWTALLREVDTALVSGRDFAFVIYGGANSAHLELDDDDDESRLIEVLKVAHRSVIVCDRDRNTDQVDRVLINRLVSAANKLPDHVRITTSVGREIENDVQPDVLCGVLEELRPQRFNKPTLSLTYVAHTIGQDDAFNDVVAKAARTTDGNALAPEQEERIRKRLDAAKHKIAERINTIGQTKSVFRDTAIQRAKEIAAWMHKS